MPHSEETPRQLGPYSVLRPLARGGMAETFVVRAPSSERDLCLKRLRWPLSADRAQQRHFEDEARILAELRHPGIVRFVDRGLAEGAPYLVTELVDGVDLRRLLSDVAARGERLDEDECLLVAVTIAEALDHAHSLGVLHRDVTPANVLLGRDGRVVLIDFGIARSDRQTERTSTGIVKGKVPYMAPEQAVAGALDARTDLFALGVVLFELLEGRRPFDAPSDVETVALAMGGTRPSLTRAAAHPALEVGIHVLLEASPARRPASARAWLERMDLGVAGARRGRLEAARASLRARVARAIEAPCVRRARTEGATRRSARGAVDLQAMLEEELPTQLDSVHGVPTRLLVEDVASTREPDEATVVSPFRADASSHEVTRETDASERTWSSHVNARDVDVDSDTLVTPRAPRRTVRLPHSVSVSLAALVVVALALACAHWTS